MATIGMSVDVYSVLERHEVCIPVTTRMNPENVVLSKSQTQKASHCGILLIRNAKIRRIEQDRK